METYFKFVQKILAAVYKSQSKRANKQQKDKLYVIRNENWLFIKKNKIN